MCAKQKEAPSPQKAERTQSVTYVTCPQAAAAHKAVKPFSSAVSTSASAFSSNLTQSVDVKGKPSEVSMWSYEEQTLNPKDLPHAWLV